MPRGDLITCGNLEGCKALCCSFVHMSVGMYAGMDVYESMSSYYDIVCDRNVLLHYV